MSDAAAVAVCFGQPNTTWLWPAWDPIGTTDMEWLVTATSFAKLHAALVSTHS